MECKLRHPIVVYTATAAKAIHQLAHQLTQQLAPTSSQKSEHIPPAYYRWLSARRGK